MDLSYSAQEKAFQIEIREFLADNLPQDLAARVAARKPLGKQDYETFHALLNSKGWLNGHWPKAFGGQGWNAVEQHIFDEESFAANAPRSIPFGLRMLAPVLMAFGSPEQQSEYLPRILDGTDWWAQGYSEPGAGSDLASLKTRAERDGDDYIINGQKTWTSYAQYANRIFCLVRTNSAGKPQEGISFLLMDLDTDGIEIRPIRTIEGGYEVNEVFFTNARVPAKNLVGTENDGWTIAKYLLLHERTNIAGVGDTMDALSKVKSQAAAITRAGRPLTQNPHFAARLAQIEIDLEAMKITNLRMLSDAQKKGAPGPEASMLKIKGTVIRQAINDLARRALGPAATPFPSEELKGNLGVAPDGHAHDAAAYFNNRKISIYGGSNEIQRNILAKGLFQP